ncbi:PH domain-containing protein [Streptomyces sp. 7-21]|uniref:PH domain-containing protein n=1 Tax=Streptomyces sp. 7-21 TaxID=2802283 RepID=UPI00191E5EC3|nr:PH domain-containing protein [Streptomyces sp. 7-21]MBL1065757.1 PH domain-containing protein [Streptomyces sp. 7-21]
MSEPVKYADRVYRSGSALVAGVLLLGLVGWLGGDALLRGDGRTPVTAVAAMLFAAPLITAFTLRPAVFAGDERLRVRNPFRTIVAPWGSVEEIRARYSCELLAGGRKYQMWSIPVSLRARNRANRFNERAESGQPSRGGLLGLGAGAQAAEGPKTAPADAAVAELRELAERHGEKESAQGPVTVRWSYAILVPLAAGAVALAVLWLTA